MIKKSGNGVNEAPWVLGILTLVTVLVWGVVLGFGFVWDDFPTIVTNPSLREGNTVFRAFSYDFWGLHALPQASGYWRPIPTLLYFLVFQVFGDSAGAFHALNLLFHVGNTLLVFFLLRSLALSSGKAFFGALFFALHPIQSEAVSFISALPDLSATFFGLLGTVFFLRKERRFSDFLWAILSLSLSLLSKESGLSFVLLWIFLEYLRSNSVLSSRLVLTGLITAAYVFLHFAVVGNDGVRPIWGEGVFQHLGTVGRVFLRHLGLGFLPLRTSPTRTMELSSGFTDPIAWASFFTFITLGFLVWKNRKSFPLVFQACIFWFIAFLPYSNLVPGEGLIADRYLYLEMAALGMFLASSLSLFPPAFQSKLSHPRVLLSFFLILSVWSFSNTRKWKSEESLWSSAIHTDPASTLAWNEFGKLRLKAGDLDRAERSFRKALKLRKQNKKASLNLAMVFQKRGKTAEAEGQIRDHLESFPQDFMAYDLLATLFIKQKRLEEAIEAQELAVKLAPDNWKILFNAGTLFLELRQLERSESLLRKARDLQPNRREIWMNFAGVLVRSRKIDEALAAYDEMLERWPGDAQVLQNREAILRWQGNR